MIRFHWELDVYQLSVQAATMVFNATQTFPRDELYSLTDQIRRSSRSVSAQIAEAWRRRIYPAAFCNKLNEAEAEAAETQVWLEYAMRCRYIPDAMGQNLHALYDDVLGKLVAMRNNAKNWNPSKL